MITDLIDIFFPEVCAGCEIFLYSGEQTICTTCRHELPLTLHHQQRDNEVYRRFYGRLPIEWASAFCYYHKKGIVQQMVHKLKYRGIEDIGKILGNWYGGLLSDVPHLSDIDIVLPVPLHPRKLRQRGYNQVDAFGKAVASSLHAAFDNDLLVRNHYSNTQTKKNLLARTSLTNELFSIKTADELESKHFLLVDDVVTTGSTIEACGKAIFQIPGARLSVVCMAMSHW